jgi:hypothetical protein
MGAFASQQNVTLDFRDGSKADIRNAKGHVRFTPRKRTFIDVFAMAAGRTL